MKIHFQMKADDKNNVVTSEGQKLHEDSLLNEGLLKPLGNSGCMVQL
jgi:hypothetical protein